MKKNRINFLIAGALPMLLALQSCLKSEESYENTIYPNALVTVKKIDDNRFFLQLDDTKTLLPVNIKSYPYKDKKHVRALTNFKEVNEPHDGYTKAVHVNWLDTIRTKGMAENLNDGNDAAYGKDPIELVRDWVTIVEDGYFTMRFRTIWGDRKITHALNLIPVAVSDTRYEVELRHNAFGDTEGRVNDGLIAFRLDKLPNTNGKTVKLKVKWKSFTGDKSVEFDYRSPADMSE